MHNYENRESYYEDFSLENIKSMKFLCRDIVNSERNAQIVCKEEEFLKEIKREI